MNAPPIPLPGTDTVIHPTGATGVPVNWRQVREALGYTQQEMANACLIRHRATICQWESGASVPSGQALRALYAHLERRRRQRRTSAFSMIEVVLAMAIIAIGVTAIMVLPVIGVRASNDAIGASHAADIGQSVTDWLLHTPGAAASLPIAPVAMPDTSQPPAGPSWVQVDGQPNMWRGVGAGYAGVYRYYASRQRGTVNAVMRCWQQPHVTTWPDGTVTTSTQVVVELTWPATSAPQDRERAAFVGMLAE